MDADRAAEELSGFLAPYPPELRSLVHAAQAELLARLAPVSQIFWDATSAVCIGFCFTGHERDNFFNLAVYSRHLTLIFPWGARLPDPDHLLLGAGSQVRNLRLAGMDTLRNPGVLALIDAAAGAARRPEVPIEPTSIVRVSAGAKRRPGVPARREPAISIARRSILRG